MWIVGQRVVSEFEPELGLGLVIKIIGSRFIEVLFSSAEISRQYASKGAPLRRLVLAAGQKIVSKDGGSVTIAEVKETNGLLLYTGEGNEIWEYEISEVVDDRNTLNQFLLGAWSRAGAFDLRKAAWKGRSLGMDPDLRGLVGARLALIPHQLHIANATAKREFPRVLLADEVGLGKTIEAGLIFSSLRALGRADHVLILVPESLKHQWLAEMYRCFNEMFTVIDQDYLEQEVASQGESAFRMNQRVICPLELLLEDPDRLEEALAEEWDLLIIDEAHHLGWNEEDPSGEWEVARLLSLHSRGLLLLTATPEFQGLETKFGLLHLVDPDRFSDFETFEIQNQGMKKTAGLAKKVLGEDRSGEVIAQLAMQAGADRELLGRIESFKQGGKPDFLLQALIDRHGTGRVLIRNRRSRLKGFPGRVLKEAALECPAEWNEHLESIKIAELEDKSLLRLASGRSGALRSQASKAAFQRRGEWLLKIFKSVKSEKILLICTRIDTVFALEAWIKSQAAIRTAVFHEELEVVERDRQAAWFSQPDGAQVLISSEIGGEGRNFQFAHHLVLFDLPLHPDLLEQRIGRLDRIGQKTPIQIHVPYFKDTPEEVLVRWYADGLGCFIKAWNGGAAGWDDSRPELVKACTAFLPKSKNFKKRKEKLKALIAHTQSSLKTILEKQQESVDVLVDLNSFDEKRAADIVKKVADLDENKMLPNFMNKVFNFFGVDTEDLDHAGTLKITAHSLSFVENFPGLSAHGERSVTFDRKLALAREEIAFLSWDHPMVQGALSLVLEGEHGRASAAIWNGVPDDVDFVIEMLFVLQVTAPADLEVDKFLPVTSWELVLSPDGTPLKTLAPPPEELRAITHKGLIERFPELNEQLLILLSNVQPHVEAQAQLAIDKARIKMEEAIQEQLGRLNSLANINPLISPRELQAAKQKALASLKALAGGSARLDAIRILVPPIS